MKLLFLMQFPKPNIISLYKKNDMKNILHIAAWVTGSIGIMMMFLGIIAFLAGGILFGHLWSNYFFPAYNFILLGTFFFLALLVTKANKK
jgi:hypothetical protein